MIGEGGAGGRKMRRRQDVRDADLRHNKESLFEQGGGGFWMSRVGHRFGRGMRWRKKTWIFIYFLEGKVEVRTYFDVQFS